MSEIDDNDLGLDIGFDGREDAADGAPDGGGDAASQSDTGRPVGADGDDGASSESPDAEDGGWGDGEPAAGDGDDSPAGGVSSLYSDLAKALAEDGILGDAEAAGRVTDADGLRGVIDSELASRLDAKQRRVLAALDAGAPQDDVRQLEAMIEDLKQYDEAKLTDESDAGVAARKEIIFRAALFNGLDEGRARKEVEKSIKAGTDIDDARDGLAMMRQSVGEAYNGMVSEGRRRQEEARRGYEERCRALEGDIMSGDGVTGKLSEGVRRRIVNNVMVRSETLPDGRQVTPLQKFCMTDPSASRILGELFTITDGFRDFGKLSEANVRKGVSRGLAAMERRLQGRQASDPGTMRYAGDGEPDAGRYEIEI